MSLNEEMIARLKDERHEGERDVGGEDDGWGAERQCAA